MMVPPLAPAPIVQDWLARHARPLSFGLHMIGIPMTIMGVLLMPVYAALISMPIFLFSTGLFVGGYLIQFLGHALEGSEPGEVAHLRKKIARSLNKRIDKTIAVAAPPQQTPGPVA